jgi:hypothetical protein
LRFYQLSRSQAADTGFIVVNFGLAGIKFRL